MTEPTLLDLGEREILRSVIPPFVQGAGDDCAQIDLPSGTLVATTDPVPPPAAATIGGDSDDFWTGWLLATINASDLAASGARPLGFMAAIECEGATPVSRFKRLLSGVRAACSELQMPYVGGNIREAKRFAAVGTAIGICDQYRPIRRNGASPGDWVVSIGQGGTFWRDALRLMSGRGMVEKESSPVYRPRAQTRAMHALARSGGLIRAAMDNSDGLLPSLAELSEKNHLGIELDLTKLRVPDLADGEVDDAARLWLGWGDWNVIAAIAPNNIASVNAIAKENGTAVHELGVFVDDHRSVILRRGDMIAAAPRLELERFARDSWMLQGVERYAELLMNVELPAQE